MAKGTRRSTMTNKRRKGFRAKLIPWLRRFGVVSVLLIALLWAGAWFFLSDADTKFADWTHNQIVEASADMGFTVNDLLLKGHRYSDPETLKAIINTGKGDPLFAFDPAAAKVMIEKMAWVKTAHIERLWPDTIYINLTERTPIALWQKGERLKLLDQDGAVIAAQDLKPFESLLIVMGEEAPVRTPDLLNHLITQPEVYQRLDSAGLISNRRWDLITKDQTRIRLPENDISAALARLAEAQSQDQLLDKNLTTIDLRDETRIVVRTKPGQVREYKTNAAF